MLSVMYLNSRPDVPPHISEFVLRARYLEIPAGVPFRHLSELQRRVENAKGCPIPSLLIRAAVVEQASGT